MSGSTARVSTRVLVRPSAARRAYDPRTWPWWVQTLAVYAVSRLFLVVVFVRVALVQEANLWTQAQPSYLSYVATLFDGTWYRTIAESGYPATLPVDSQGLVTQNAWAFFPAFPMLVRAVMNLTGGTWIVVAPLVATVLGAAAMVVVHRVITVGAPRAVAAWPGLPLATVAVVCAFPTSGVLQVAYTESLALLLIASALLLVIRRRYEWAALVVIVLGFTRAVALPMAVVVVVHGLVRWQAGRRGEDKLPVRDVVRMGALTVVAVLSGFVWPAVCGWATGVPDGYLLTQESWRWAKTVEPFIGWTYVPQYWFGSWAPVVVVGGLGLTALTILMPSAWRLGRELHAWAASYVLYIAAVAEPGSSLARFLLLAFPLGAATVGVVTSSPRARRRWLALLLIAMLAFQVLWVRQIWLFNPHGDWPP
ncbi:MAG: hypothetical protein L6367_14400 [Cellulomonas sp.]|nr:hypothetical protein [Cellulomonas sp.]